MVKHPQTLSHCEFSRYIIRANPFVGIGKIDGLKMLVAFPGAFIEMEVKRPIFQQVINYRYHCCDYSF